MFYSKSTLVSFISRNNFWTKSTDNNCTKLYNVNMMYIKKEHRLFAIGVVLIYDL